MLCLQQLETQALASLRAALSPAVTIETYGGEFRDLSNLPASNPSLPVVWVWAQGLNTERGGDMTRGRLTLQLMAAAPATRDVNGVPGVFSLLEDAHLALENWDINLGGLPVLGETKCHLLDRDRGLAVYISTYHLKIMTKDFSPDFSRNRTQR